MSHGPGVGPPGAIRLLSSVKQTRRHIESVQKRGRKWGILLPINRAPKGELAANFFRVRDWYITVATPPARIASVSRFTWPASIVSTRSEKVGKDRRANSGPVRGGDEDRSPPSNYVLAPPPYTKNTRLE